MGVPSHSTQEDLAAGVEFGGYVVREPIGRGGMATVYRAEHLLLNKPVALKVMERSLLASDAGLQRFLREGRAAAAIKHPNVVDVTDVGVHDGVPYLVMELLRGRDLDAHLVERKLLDEGSVIRMALPVIAALGTAHDRGVVHRDIKPSNIFLSIGPDEQVVPKVLDFGISKLSFEQAADEQVTTPQHQLIGTPRYLPPEALQSAGELGPLSDQYSLGVVLYHCVTGRTPFTGTTLLSLLESLSRGRFEPPRTLQPSLSPGLERVILRALSPDPNDRFPTLRDMGRALLELAAERTQIVWARSFPAPPSRRAEQPTHAPPSATARTERLTSNQLPRPSRWRSVALGVGLVLSGALAARLWPTLRRATVPAPEPAAPQWVATPAVAATAPAAATTTTAAAAATAAPAKADATATKPLPETRSVALRPSESLTPRRAAPSAARRAPSAAPRGPAPAPQRRSKPPPAARSDLAPVEQRASAPAASHPPQAPPAPRRGANGSPLLD